MSTPEVTGPTVTSIEQQIRTQLTPEAQKALRSRLESYTWHYTIIQLPLTDTADNWGTGWVTAPTDEEAKDRIAFDAVCGIFFCAADAAIREHGLDATVLLSPLALEIYNFGRDTVTMHLDWDSNDIGDEILDKFSKLDDFASAMRELRTLATKRKKLVVILENVGDGIDS